MKLISKKTLCFLLAAISGLLLFSCAEKNNNSLLQYLDSCEIQYEGTAQKNNLITALKDILVLPAQELKNKKYRDYKGNENSWDLPTLFTRHFVPDSAGKTPGTNFYNEIKSTDVLARIKEIIAELEKNE